jgi:hypothetical protein
MLLNRIKLLFLVMGTAYVPFGRKWSVYVIFIKFRLQIKLCPCELLLTEVSQAPSLYSMSCGYHTSNIVRMTQHQRTETLHVYTFRSFTVIKVIFCLRIWASSSNCVNQTVTRVTDFRLPRAKCIF